MEILIYIYIYINTQKRKINYKLTKSLHILSYNKYFIFKIVNALV